MYDNICLGMLFRNIYKKKILGATVLKKLLYDLY